MAQLQLIKQSPGILIPATPETSEFLQSKCKLGAVLVADFKQVRNPAFHRRFSRFSIWGSNTGNPPAALSPRTSANWLPATPDSRLRSAAMSRRF